MPPKRHTQAGHVSKSKASTASHQALTSTFHHLQLNEPPVHSINDLME
jgi:hypothetical protein